MLKTLLKKQWLEMTASFRRSSATGRARTGWKAAAFLALAVAVALLVMGSVALLAALLCRPLCEAGLDWLYFALMALPALLAGVAGGGFAAYGTLYAARDNEQLLALPIPPGLILAVRMGSVWLLGAGYLAVILAPAYLVYLLLGPRPLAAALAMLPVTVLLGCLVLAGSCLAGWLAALLGSRVVRYKALLSLFYTVLILIFAFGSNFAVRSGLIWLLTHLDQASAGLRADAQAVYLLGCAALGDLPSLALLAAVSLGAAALAWLLLRRSYLRMMTTRRGGARAVYQAKPVRVRSVRAALLAREMRRLGSCTSYMVNGLLGSVLLLAAAAGAVWKAELLRGALALLPGFAASGPVLACAAVCSLAAMNLLTPPSVSLEGRTLWLVQSLPVSPWQALRAKLDLHMALTAPPALLAAVCLLGAVGSGPLAAALVLAAVWLYTLLAGALGLVLGVKLPNLHWTSETAAVKQGAAPVTALFANWAALTLLCGLWWLAQPLLGGFGALGLCCVCLAAGCAGALGFLRRGGSRAFARL